jgi:hypothetical protein
MADFDHRAASRLAYRILVRRRLRCIREGKHTIGYCKACGVHQ